jgi:hypothetical protein
LYLCKEYYTFVRNLIRIILMDLPNVQLVRSELPHGSIKKIAEAIGIPLKTVSEFFTNGWHQQYSNAILTEAMTIIREKYPDEELLSEYKELGLSRGHSYAKPKKQRSVATERGSGSTLGWLLGIAGIVVGAYFVLPEVKQFVDDKIFAGKRKLTPEEEQALIVTAAQAGRK